MLSKPTVVEHPVAGQSRLAGYQVTYSYQGQTYTVLMPSDPGSRVMI
ncbi:MAG: hypothetical protein MO853_12205 [Candidatus Protistobacter heckmanni]|nr:hypothetical protein [Candidatus Protistobacter heckmanni]